MLHCVCVVGVCSFGFEPEKICSGGAEEEEEEAEYSEFFWKVWKTVQGGEREGEGE